jgi:hypothetical protein
MGSMVHFESEVFANQELHPYWSKVKDTVKKFYKLCQGNRIILLLRIQDLLVVMPSFLILPSQLFSKDMNISNQTIALKAANSI